MRKGLVFALCLAGCVQSLTPVQYEAAITAALRENGCRFTGGTGGDEEAFAQLLSPQLGVSPGALLDREGPYYDGVDDAIDSMADRGDLTLDASARTVILSDCP